jgi:sensor histidine kinase YesM
MDLIIEKRKALIMNKKYFIIRNIYTQTSKGDHTMEEQSSDYFELKHQPINFKNVCKDLFNMFVLVLIVALVLAVFNSGKFILSNLILCITFGLTVPSLFFLLSSLFKPQRWGSLLLVATIASSGGILIGMLVLYVILKFLFGISNLATWKDLINLFFNAMIISSGIFYFFITQSRLKYRREVIDKERARRAEVEKQALESRLKMLQAQIEPHFLFNTLSNIISLIDTEPSKGKTMLIDLTKYLRASLSRTLPEKMTLALEMDMIKEYLNIQKIRMGERLNFTFNVPDVLLGHHFPPMLLQPLVENSVKHGLEPKIEGGEILITVSKDDHLLKVEVIDTGLGFSTIDPKGVGLANVRERLGLLFGEKGRLIIEENHPCGVRAFIEAPIND